MEHGAARLVEAPLPPQNQPPNPRIGLCGLVPEELVEIRIDTGRRLARSDGADDGDSGVETAFRDREPGRCGGAASSGSLVPLAKDKRQIPPLTDGRIRRQKP